MATRKRKISVSLDADLVEELERGDEALSAQINDAIRATVERRRNQRLLQALLNDLYERYGPPPKALVDKYEELLR